MWTGHAKLPLSVRDISRVNMWGYGNRGLGGIVFGAGSMGLLLLFNDSITPKCESL